MAKRYRFEWIAPIYTGGNIYILFGKVANGDWFTASDDMYDVRFLNANPYEEDYEFCFVGDSVEWQEEHLVRDLYGEDECLDFWKSALRWCIKHEPDGNYSVSDLESDLREVNRLYGTKGWR